LVIAAGSISRFPAGEEMDIGSTADITASKEARGADELENPTASPLLKGAMNQLRSAHVEIGGDVN
jgi:hypothetical protein